MNGPAPGGLGAGPGELKLRVASALVLAVGILLATVWGGWPFRLVWVLVAGLVAYEWLSIVSRDNAVAGGIGVVLAGLVLGFSPSSQPALAGVSAAAALIGAVATPFVQARLAPGDLRGCLCARLRARHAGPAGPAGARLRHHHLELRGGLVHRYRGLFHRPQRSAGRS